MNHINLSNQSTQTLYYMTSTSIDHQYTQLKTKHSSLVTATTNFAKQTLTHAVESSKCIALKKSFASQQAILKRVRAKQNTANLKVADSKVKEADWNAERNLLRKQAQTGRSSITSNKCNDMVFHAELEVEKTAAKMDLQKLSKKQEKGKQMKQKTKCFNKVRGILWSGHFVSFVFNLFLFGSLH